MDMQQVQKGDNASVGHGNAWQQTPADVLIHGHPSADGDPKDVFGKRKYSTNSDTSTISLYSRPLKSI